MTDSHKFDAAEFRAVFRQLRRRIGLVVSCFLAFPAVTVAASLLHEEEYSASAPLLFRDPVFDQKLFGATFLGPSRNADRDATTNLRLVSLDVVARRAARRLGGNTTAKAIGNEVKVSQIGLADVVSVTATDRDPDEAARLVNAFTAEYVTFRKEADRAKIQEAQTLFGTELAGLSRSERTGKEGRSLQKRSEELGVLASLQTGNAEILQQASPPSSPSSPKPARNGVLGAVVGLIFAVGLALLLERLDHRVRDGEDIEAIFERPALGAVLESRALEGGPVNSGLSFSEAEAFRMLRANLRYFNVDHDIRSVLITSAAPGDGKTTVAWNLATTAAENEGRVLLIEADLRHPGIAEGLGMRNVQGLSTILAGEGSLGTVVQEVPVPERQNGRGARTVEVLLSGPLPPNPSDLLESERMRELIAEAEREYDLVVIDTPPMSVVSDALPLIKEIDGVIVVGRLAKTTRDALARLKQQMDNLGAPLLGIVINSVKSDADGYGYGYGDSYGEQFSEEASQGADAVRS